MSINQFLRFGIGYLLIATLIAFLVRDNAAEVVGEKISIFVNAIPMLLFVAFTLVSLGLVGSAIYQTKRPRDMIIHALLASIGTACFQAAFLVIKTSMPFILPFFADPGFVEIDRIIHLGTDPWAMTHNWSQYVPLEWLAGIYLHGWLTIAIILPIALATLDSDETRVRRILILYVSAWIIIGNLLALAGLSVGPIYFDRLYGGEYFADLPGSFLPIEANMEIIRKAQESLWILYEHFDQSQGTGISAFPSVHVSVATLVGLYLYERSAYLLPLAVIWVAAILYMSVYTGYHYAIDGYVSIAVIVGLWLYLRRRGEKDAQYD
ncbi:phosphatase PAP2 family protein [Aliiroseovarius sp. Z3]|uniref:phosphatase PAP2 family protein n=1 Tax=Aliiroseovarius sp. Z3 TaxID=2811402 RepID=UPI0023B2464B|nr:phosphatase PAP2 family protein [Aliiroseovarius sp. Z3]MDE9449634.1 phosphatase PAP2 family protein [Aliiroseovarius sp. Z3]